MPDLIKELYVWICTEPDGGEGIPAIKMHDMIMPLVGADRQRIESLRPAAESVAIDKGYPMKLVKFSHMEILEVLE